jgi:hypothetical protein
MPESRELLNYVGGEFKPTREGDTLAPLGRPKVNERVIFSGRDTKERTAFGSVPSAKAWRYEVAR